MEAAAKLAPYQSPKLGMLMIQPTPEQDRLRQMTDEELMASLTRRANAMGIEIIIRRKGQPQLAPNSQVRRRLQVFNEAKPLGRD